MGSKRRPWQEELEIIDRTMRTISSIRDPEQLVTAYWNGIGSLIPDSDYISMSRRNVPPPEYLITRSSRFKEDLNPWTQRDRLPRMSGGILGEVIYANHPVIIEDLSARLKPDDPAHYYLQGCELLIGLPQYDGGEGLNATVMLHPPGHGFDMSIIPMLHWQAGLFGRGTTNQVLRNQLSEALADLDRELQVVGSIQRSLLPRELPQIDGFDIASHYLTSARAGGDYYDFFPLPGGRWGAFIADVSGHGTPAAVLMAITHALAHAQPGTHTPPAQLLTYLNGQLARSYTRNGTFVTAFYAVIDPENRTMTYSRAGHNPPRLVRGEHVLSLEEVGSLPMGLTVEQSYDQATVTLQPDDLLLLYTDGITEAVAAPKAGEPRHLFGIERLDQLLLDCGCARAIECIERIRSEVASFCHGAPPTDDQTLIAIRCR
jgi:sigma-B regulation protein RsbU (phosphoserine phosphatase)